MAGLDKCIFASVHKCERCEHVVFASCRLYAHSLIRSLIHPLLPFNRDASFTVPADTEVVWGAVAKGDASVKDKVKSVCAAECCRIKTKIRHMSINQMMQFTLGDEREFDFYVCYLELVADRVFFADPAEMAKADKHQNIGAAIFKDRASRIFESFCDLCITRGIKVYATFDGVQLKGLTFSRDKWVEVKPSGVVTAKAKGVKVSKISGGGSDGGAISF